MGMFWKYLVLQYNFRSKYLTISKLMDITITINEALLKMYGIINGALVYNIFAFYEKKKRFIIKIDNRDLEKINSVLAYTHGSTGNIRLKLICKSPFLHSVTDKI